MENEIFNYEMKLIDEVSHSRFSFRKVLKLLKINAIAEHN